MSGRLVQRDALRCSVLQCVAVCCSVLHPVILFRRALVGILCIALCFGVLQVGAVCCSVILHVAVL